MSIKKYLDWRGYIEGFYLTWSKAITTTLLALIGTNGVEKLGTLVGTSVEKLGVKGIGLSWKQAGGVLATLTVIEILKYVQARPMPETLTENTDTTISVKPPTEGNENAK